MNNCKYRYFMNGMFDPTDGNTYEIDIPSPFIRDSKEEAMADGDFAYRFAKIDKSDEPVIVIFEKEDFKVTTDEKGRRCLDTWVEGKIIGTYTFERFKKRGGYIRMLKPECKGKFCLDVDVFIPTEKTFSYVFPNIEPQKLYYIDDEAYSIEEVHKRSQSNDDQLIPQLQYIKEFKNKDNLDHILDLLDDYIELKESI